MHSESFTAELEAKELGGLLHQAIMELPMRFRSAVVLCDFEGLSYLDAAASLGIPLGTLQSRLGRARRRLRERLSRRGTISLATTPRPGLSGGNLVNLTKPVSLPRTLLGRTCHMAVSWINHQSDRDAVVSSSVRALAIKGSRATVKSNLTGITALLTTAGISAGVMAFHNQTSADPGRGKTPPQTQGLDEPKSKGRTALPPIVDLPAVPAPRELRVVTGQGKARVFALDPAGERFSERPGDPRSPALEASLDIRWAVVTGIVDHRAIQKSFSHVDDLARTPRTRIYRRVDLELQILQRGVSSKWRAVDQKKLYRILENLPVRGAERIPRDVRLDALVDPLPALTDGVWEGVDVERLVLNEVERQA